MSQKQWMWYNEASNGVSAVIVDFEDNRVQWFDEPGCACSGSHAEQTIEDFLANGSSALTPPDDVLAEMKAELQAKVSL